MLRFFIKNTFNHLVTEIKNITKLIKTLLEKVNDTGSWQMNVFTSVLRKNGVNLFLSPHAISVGMFSKLLV